MVPPTTSTCAATHPSFFGLDVARRPHDQTCLSEVKRSFVDESVHADDLDDATGQPKTDSRLVSVQPRLQLNVSTVRGLTWR
nr:hypothetical protein CFP56_73202 [Quercus suber]